MVEVMDAVEPLRHADESVLNTENARFSGLLRKNGLWMKLCATHWKFVHIRKTVTAPSASVHASGRVVE